MTTILGKVVFFISQLGEVIRSTDLLAFMTKYEGIQNIWNYLKILVPIDVSYLRFKKLALSYLIANDIVYRVKSYIFYFTMLILNIKLSIYSILTCCLNYIFDVA